MVSLKCCLKLQILKIYRGKIIECTFHRFTKTWVPLRIRIDKDAPNTIYVAKATEHAVHDGVSIEDFKI